MNRRGFFFTAMSMMMFLSVGGKAGCKNGEKRGEEIPFVPVESEKYENCIEIEGQWGANYATGANGEYGIGDPFVMRYNGKYYLYPSTSDPYNGVKVFESDDLVHWQYKGFALSESEETSHGAYAPEVVYYNGYFYMCQSRGGNGHYIYRSESPTEGFSLYSASKEGTTEDLNYGNLGMGIDGSFYLSDDGKLYLMHTSVPAGLKINEFTDIENICAETMGKTYSLEDANLRHWIEGPGIFRRGEYSYLTYTGNHVISKGYRVGYSYAKNLSDFSSFIQPIDNITIMDTDENHYGLGHSSNTVGPDLDSIYTAYHSLVGNGPARRYNLDRYFASGRVLTANGVTHRKVNVPASPTGEAKDKTELTSIEKKYIVGESKGYFTAEYNFIPTATQTLFFGVQNASGYKIQMSDNTITLKKYTEEKEEILASSTMEIREEKLATVRCENGNGVGYIYLNGRRVLSYSAEKAEGKIGYASLNGVGYSAFTDEVFGTSDFEAVKNLPTKFPATSYLKGENRGFSILGATIKKGGIRVGEKESITQIGDDFAVCLNTNDWIKYATDAPSDGMYSIAAEVLAGSDATIKITIGNEQLITQISASSEDENSTVKLSLGRIYAEEGVKSIKVQVLSGKAEFVAFEIYENAEELNNVKISDFEKIRGNVTFSADTMEVSGVDTHSVALWGNSGIADFEAKIEFTTNVDAASNLGFMFRASNYSYYKDQPTQSFRGYFIKITLQLLSISRYDYGEDLLAATRMGEISVGDGQKHTLSIYAKSNKVILCLDGSLKMEVQDNCAFLSGKLGVFASSGSLQVLGFDYRII